MFGGNNRDTTKLQDCILQQYDMGVTDPTQIAARCNCSESYARETIEEYRGGGGGGIFF